MDLVFDYSELNLLHELVVSMGMCPVLHNY